MKNGPYELVVAPSDYPGKLYRGRYCYEHHLVFWQHTGIVIADDECIHHVNDSKRDNVIENLVLLKKSKHSSLHAQEAEVWTMVCEWCKVEMYRTARDIREKIKRGQKHFYCSLSCGATHQFSGDKYA